MKELTFYRCNLCGNLICMVNDSGVTPTCCGEEMELITANTVDAAIEKHTPVIQQNGNKILVSIGSTYHPMTKDHFIEWVILQTDHGTYNQCLMPECIPEVCFRICPDECPVRAYAWCNLHGLWVRNMDG